MILVTGAAGFVGSRAVRGLAETDQVRALVHRKPTGLEGIDAVVADITKPETLPAALEGVDVVVHAAAITGDRKEPHRGAYDEVNRVGTENLVAAARQAGARHFVLVSGLGTRPAAPRTYMATRWGAEEAVRSSGLTFVILQPSVLFGPRAPFIAALAGLVRTSPVVPAIGSGRLRFQPLHVDDLVTCIESACRDRSLAGRAYPIGGSEHVTFRQVLETIATAIGKRRLVVPIPMPLARVQARLMTALLPNPPLTPAALELFSFDNATDLDAVDRSFGFHPRGFREHVLAHGLDA